MAKSIKAIKIFFANINVFLRWKQKTKGPRITKRVYRKNRFENVINLKNLDFLIGNCYGNQDSVKMDSQRYVGQMKVSMHLYVG